MRPSYISDLVLYMSHWHDVALTALEFSGYQWVAQFLFILRLIYLSETFNNSNFISRYALLPHDHEFKFLTFLQVC